MPSVAAFDAIIDRLKWSWDRLQTFKLRMVDARVGYHWVPVTETDAQGRRYREFVVDQAKPLPDDLKFIVGDCIHSLRASLDNLVYTLCPTDRAEFPVCTTPKRWRRDLWKIKDLDSAVLLIVEEVQPFKGENAEHPERDPLWTLDRLWNDDKHRAPHLVMGALDLSSLSSGPGGWLHAVDCLGGPLEVGSVVAKVWFLPDSEPEIEANFGFDVTFDPLGPGRGQSVYHCLANLHDIVGDIVERFRPFFV